MNGLILIAALVTGQSTVLHDVREPSPNHVAGQPCRTCGNDNYTRNGVYVGQGECPTGNCQQPRDPIARSRIEGPPRKGKWPAGVDIVDVNPDGAAKDKGQPTPAPTGLKANCVRIGVPIGGGSVALGSGTIVAVEGGKAFVVTARHVVDGIDPDGDGKLTIRYGDQRFEGHLISVGNGGDLAAIIFDAPTGVKSLEIAPNGAISATCLGWGGGSASLPASRLLHSYRGSYRRPMNTTHERGPDAEYGFYPTEGDSGGGVFDDQGRFAGVLWGKVPESRTAAVVSIAKVHKFLEVKVQQVGDEKRVTWLFPFFFKKRVIRTPDPAPAQAEPVQPPSYVQPQPVPPPAQPVVPPTVVQGPAGPQGPQGLPGAAAPAQDLSGIQADIAALKGQMAAIVPILQNLQTTTAATAALVQKPITFLDPQPDGSEQARAVGLGGTIRLSIPNPATNHIQQAQGAAQSNAVPRPPAPGK